MDTKLKEIGARVREARSDLGMNQTELAEKAQLHPTYISQIENGKANLSVEVFIRITEALQVSADWLLQSNVPSVAKLQNDEVVELLSDCNQAETKAIIKMIREFKNALKSTQS